MPYRIRIEDAEELVDLSKYLDNLRDELVAEGLKTYNFNTILREREDGGFYMTFSVKNGGMLRRLKKHIPYTFRRVKKEKKFVPKDEDREIAGEALKELNKF